MEYSDWAAAFSENNTTKINQLFEELRPRLMSYLYVHMNASKAEAEDCIQDAFLASLETIEDGKMQNAEYLLSYLLSTCRNNYLNLKKKKGLQRVDQQPDETTLPPKQLTALLNEEKQKLLAECLDSLTDNYRTFINYWLAHPGYEAKRAASRFNMSVSNVWTKKHRIIKKLNACYQKKIKK